MAGRNTLKIEFPKRRVSYYLECRTMVRVQKPTDSEFRKVVFFKAFLGIPDNIQIPNASVIYDRQKSLEFKCHSIIHKSHLG
jgi:hypothetical protein